MSCSPGKAVLDIVCGSLSASLCVKDLYNGSSCCVLLGSVVLTPCEFERRAGRGSTKNWKKSIRYCGRLLQACQPSRIYRETHDFTTKLKVSQAVALNSRIFS